MLSVITTYNNIVGLHGLLFTSQYGFNQGMKEFEQAGYNATISKLSNNIIGMNVVDMLNKKRIASGVYFNVLSYLMLLKRKRIGAVKARGCANGRSQRKFILKDESSSPTVSTYVLFISCTMNATEGRQVVTCNIPRAFLQVDWPKDNDCYLKFEGLMVKMICEIDPSYEKYVLTNKTTSKKNCMGISPRQFMGYC